MAMSFSIAVVFVFSLICRFFLFFFILKLFPYVDNSHNEIRKKKIIIFPEIFIKILSDNL